MKKRFLEWLINALGYRVKAEVELVFKVKPDDWEGSDAEKWDEFLESQTGRALLDQVRAHQIELAEWASDVSAGNHEDMKYRACIAYGVRIAHVKMLSLRKRKEGSPNEFLSDEKFEEFLNSRLSMFKS